MPEPAGSDVATDSGSTLSTQDVQDLGLGTSADALSTQTQAEVEGGSGKQGAQSEQLGESGKAKVGEAAGQGRDAQGRFTAPAGSEPAAAAKFKFGGREFDSLEHAENTFKSYFGRQRAWEERYSALQAELAQAKAAGQEPAATGGEASPAAKQAAASVEAKLPAELADAVDYALFQEIWDDPGLGPKRAIQYTLMKVGEYMQGMRAELEARQSPEDPRLAGMFRDHESQHAFNETVMTFQKLADRVDPKGHPVYPELTQDQDFTARVAERWMKNDTLRMQGEYGAHLAYLDELNWTNYMIRTAGAEAGVTPGAVTPKPAPAASPRADNVLTESGSPTIKAPARRGGSAVDVMLDDMEKYGKAKEDGALLGLT